MDHTLAAALVVYGIPIVCTFGGVVMGSLLNATLTARASKRELEQADQHDLLERLRELELYRARQEGRETQTTTTTERKPT